MVKSRLIHLILPLILVFSIAAGIVVSQSTAFAQDTTPTPTPTSTEPLLTLKTDFPSYSDNSGSTFSFDVTLSYNGNDRKTVNLSLTGPQGWTSSLTYQSKQVSAVDMGPADQYGPDTKTLTVTMTPNSGSSPDPASYSSTLTATSGDLNASITLTAVVKDKYSMYTTTDSGLLSTNAVVGKDNTFTFKVVNDGTASLDNVTFSDTGPTGWNVRFNPAKIDSLGAGQTQQVDAIINPPANQTVAGDYMLNFSASSGSTTSSLNVRVTVLTSSIMGVVAIVIVAIVIIGLMVLFWRLGRR
jgi:uncharacterized repeat protein (TIGR01451 family)